MILNLIGNTCIPSWITTKLLNQQFVNPFTWCIMDFTSSYNLVKYFDKINFNKFELKTNNFKSFSIIVDQLVTIQYVHYHFDPDATHILTKRNDVFYNRIWEFIVEKYRTRCKRMIECGSPPIFIFACANNRKITYDGSTNVNFTIEQQKMLYELNSPYRIITSYKELYPNENAIEQTLTFNDNGMPIASYLFDRMKLGT